MSTKIHGCHPDLTIGPLAMDLSPLDPLPLDLLPLDLAPLNLSTSYFIRTPCDSKNQHVNDSSYFRPLDRLIDGCSSTCLECSWTETGLRHRFDHGRHSIKRPPCARHTASS